MSVTAMPVLASVRVAVISPGRADTEALRNSIDSTRGAMRQHDSSARALLTDDILALAGNQDRLRAGCWKRLDGVDQFIDRSTVILGVEECRDVHGHHHGVLRLRLALRMRH